VGFWGARVPKEAQKKIGCFWRFLRLIWHPNIFKSYLLNSFIISI
jgi:hypothetical protein